MPSVFGLVMLVMRIGYFDSIQMSFFVDFMCWKDSTFYPAAIQNYNCAALIYHGTIKIRQFPQEIIG